ncbi:MAG: hypothetical protein ABJK43_06320 [Lentilitoribacter sp.]
MVNKEPPFRFYDSRQKYLLFINTCNEKWETAKRIEQELEYIDPTPPAIRLFDAGMGDGTVLSRVMRSMHRRFSNIPFYIVGKEISLEDVRLSLDKLPDRLYEHPATCFIATNLYYFQAPWLSLKGKGDDQDINWIFMELDGEHSDEFAEQITAAQKNIANQWQARTNINTGNHAYEKPTVLVIYRKDQKFLLNDIIPKRETIKADFDLVIASQPYRARVPVSFKVKNVVAPLVKALAPKGRFIGVHSHGADPGLEIIREIWPGENPFHTDRFSIEEELRTSFPEVADKCRLVDHNQTEATFRYEMHTLPDEISNHPAKIGTSTLLAAWNATSYVAQIDDERLEKVIADRHYLDVTRDKLAEHGGLWFKNESYTFIKRDGSGR